MSDETNQADAELTGLRSRTRTRTRRLEPTSGTAEDATAIESVPAGTEPPVSQRRRRGRRRRRGAPAAGAPAVASAAAGPQPQATTAADTAAGDPVVAPSEEDWPPPATEPGADPALPAAVEATAVAIPVTEESLPSEVEQRIAPGGTRLAAKRRARNRGRGLPSPGRHRPSTVPDEVRRAVLDGPPRSMLVTTSGDRTQIAVLEDRTVVEHYVTRTADVSYVGNIYMARVQNVLPGMEAAFLDIGKGRNGVLYAGEVLYDELDLEEGEEPRIESALKPGQKVLVQVTKDPMGSKGARLTMQLSLAGRYMVLAPNDGIFGISRKLAEDERDRLRRILKRLKPEGMGVIVRTAAAEATEEQLQDDLARLLAKWDVVQQRVKTAKAPEPVYEEPDLVVRVIRDHFGPEFVNLVVDNPDVHAKVRAYMEEIMPEALDKLQLYQPPESDGDQAARLFDAYHVTEQLRKALERKVWLPSGGYLIIERTEAMTIIDVNTGKFTGATNLEETVLRTNLEAAEEVVRQLRLRDIGGMIIIDFIDMLLDTSREQLIHRLKRELLRDRTKTRVSDVSKLGLVQMTRKNVSQGLIEAFSERCPECEGRGYKVNRSLD